jgi:hypothetical protein
MYQPFYKCKVCESPLRSEGYCKECVDSFAAWRASGVGLNDVFFGMCERCAVALMQEYAA